MDNPKPERRMTKAERDDLIRLIKQRERVAKTAAEQRSAAMLAEFEQSVSKLHSWSNDDVWRLAVEASVEAARKANEEINKRAAELGIPEEFRPKLAYSWQRRGDNELATRRTELRRLAQAEITALEKVARVQIEQASVQAQTEIIANGLSSEDAIAFFNKLPAIETMMPVLDVTVIQAKLADRARHSPGYRGPRLIDND